MMNKQTEALKMAIEALEWIRYGERTNKQLEAIEACKEALEQPSNMVTVPLDKLQDMQRRLREYEKDRLERDNYLEKEARLVSYAPDKSTCTLNIDGEEVYFNREQPAQEPVMNVTLSCGCKSSELGFPSEWDGETRECEPCTKHGMLCMKHFYAWNARPAQTHHAPSWQGLSDDDCLNIWDLIDTWEGNELPHTDIIRFASAIEQALKEKNER